MKLEQVISCDPEVFSGVSVFTGTRVPVASLIAHLEAGESLDDFLDGFPTVSRQQAEAVLDMALDSLLEQFEHARTA